VNYHGGYDAMSIWKCPEPGCEFNVMCFATPDRLARVPWLVALDDQKIAEMSQRHREEEHADG
jgi:hypothetical protein